MEVAGLAATQAGSAEGGGGGGDDTPAKRRRRLPAAVAAAAAPLLCWCSTACRAATAELEVDECGPPGFRAADESRWFRRGADCAELTPPLLQLLVPLRSTLLLPLLLSLCKS